MARMDEEYTVLKALERAIDKYKVFSSGHLDGIRYVLITSAQGSFNKSLRPKNILWYGELYLENGVPAIRKVEFGSHYIGTKARRWINKKTPEFDEVSQWILTKNYTFDKFSNTVILYVNRVATQADVEEGKSAEDYYDDIYDDIFMS